MLHVWAVRRFETLLWSGYEVTIFGKGQKLTPLLSQKPKLIVRKETWMWRALDNLWCELIYMLANTYRRVQLLAAHHRSTAPVTVSTVRFQWVNPKLYRKHTTFWNQKRLCWTKLRWLLQLRLFGGNPSREKKTFTPSKNLVQENMFKKCIFFGLYSENFWSSRIQSVFWLYNSIEYSRTHRYSQHGRSRY